MTATLEKKFEYGIARVKDFAVNAIEVPRGKHKYNKAVDVTIKGEKFRPSKRFWTSIQCRFGFSPNIFRYFTHEEVFERISTKAPNDQIRYCVERDSNTLLAVTNPNGASVRFDQLTDLLTRYGSKALSYTNGVVRSTHAPKIGAAPFEISGDKFANQFVIDTPIDGFGRPNIYLSLLRLVCTNGAIGYGKAFRSELSTGKTDQDVAFALIRAMDGFNNEDGFAAMRERFESATTSWASVNETQRLYKLLAGLANTAGLVKQGRETVTLANGTTEVVETASPVFHSFHKMTGDVTKLYGLTNLDSLSVKRQRTLPAGCKVYDLLNFASELATHQSTPEGARRVQAYIGDIVSNEYDLEGTVDQFSDWQDFFLSDQNAIESKRILDNKLMR